MNVGRVCRAAGPDSEEQNNNFISKAQLLAFIMSATIQ
jgi:hypothetical protein